MFYKNKKLVSYFIFLLILSIYINFLLIKYYNTSNISNFLILFVLLFYSLNLIWYYYPHEFFDTEYEIKNKDVNINNFNNSLFVYNHNDLEDYQKYKDAMIMTHQIHKSDKSFSLITEYPSLKYFPIVKGYDFIFKGENACDKMINSLKKGNNGIIFLIDKHNNEGIYYILKETKVPLILIKKKWNKHKKIEIEYKEIKYDTNLTPSKFMDNIKKILFI